MDDGDGRGQFGLWVRLDPGTQPPAGALARKGFALFFDKILHLKRKTLYKRRKRTIIGTVNSNFFDTARGGDSRRDSERRGGAGQARVLVSPRPGSAQAMKRPGSAPAQPGKRYFLS